jgi:hypothetical protein
MLMRSVLFLGVTQRRVVILYRRFGITYQFHLQGSRSSKKFKNFLTLEDRTGTLSRNVDKGLPLDAAQHPRRVKILQKKVTVIGLVDLNNVRIISLDKSIVTAVTRLRIYTRKYSLFCKQ